MRHLIGLLVTGLAATAAFGQVPVSGGDGATLQRIAGTDTRVTVILKDAGAEIANLRITELRDGHFETINEQGVESYFPYDAVSGIRVQGGIVEVSTRDVLGDRALSEDEAKALAEAMDKVRELFRTAVDNQRIRMDAAVLLMVAGEDDQKAAAEEYLRQLLDTTDIQTRMSAALSLYEAGDPGPAAEVALEGLNNRDRSVRAVGAVLAGLAKLEDAELQLNRMVRDRAADVSAPAAWALGKIGDRDALPTIINMLTDRNPTRAEAAVSALIDMGDDELIEGLQVELERQEGLARFRVARVLHALGDEVGTNVIRNEYLESQAGPIRHQAAIILAKDGDVKALQTLREDLRSRYDPTPAELVRRAQAVAALTAAGDRTYLGAFQELLGQSNQFESRDPAVQLRNQVGEIAVLAVIALSGDRTLLTTINPSVSSREPMVAITACSAAVAITNEEYRERIRSIFSPETT